MKYGVIVMTLLALGCSPKPPPPTPIQLDAAVLAYVWGQTDFVLEANSGFRSEPRVCAVRDKFDGRVAINIEHWPDAGIFDAFGLEFTFDQTAYNFVGVQKTTPLLDTFYFGYGNLSDKETGRIRIGGAALKGIDPGTVTLCYVHLDPIPIPPESTEFVVENFTDHFGKAKRCVTWARN